MQPYFLIPFGHLSAKSRFCKDVMLRLRSYKLPWHNGFYEELWRWRDIVNRNARVSSLWLPWYIWNIEKKNSNSNSNLIFTSYVPLFMLWCCVCLSTWRRVNSEMIVLWVSTQAVKPYHRSYIPFVKYFLLADVNNLRTKEQRHWKKVNYAYISD